MKKQNIISISIFLLIIVIGAILFINNNKSKVNISEFSPIISKLDNGNYYIFGASRDYTFEIEKNDNYSYEIKDENNNKIIPIIEDKTDKVIIKAPKELYEEGKTYTLTIKNTTFISENLKDSNVVKFSIVRKSSNSYEYKNNVNKVSSKDIKVIDNVLTTKNKYNIDDVIVLEDSGIKALYKVLNKNDDGTYKVANADLEEVFSKYDYYKVESVDLSSFETDKELQNYILCGVKKSILDYFIDNVNATPKFKVEASKYNKETGKITLKLELSVEAKDKLFKLNFLENHDLKLVFEVSVGLKLYSDITITKQDIALKLDLDIKPKFEIKSRNEFIRNLKDVVDKKTKDGEYTHSWLDIKEIPGDNIDSDLKLGKTAIPTSVPGLYVSLSTGMLYEFDLKASFEANAKTNISVTFGVRKPHKGKSPTIYSNYESNGTMSIGAGGKFESKLGLKNTAGIEFINIISLTGNVESGIYTEGLVYAKIKEEETNTYPLIESNIEGGLFTEVNVKINVVEIEFKKKIYDVKLPLVKINEVIDFNKETTPTLKEENNNDEYTLKLYGFGNCSASYGAPPTVELMNTYKIKNNEKLNENIELMNNSSIIELSYETNIDENIYHYGIYKYSDFNTYLEEVDKTYKERQKCENKCINDYGEDNSYSCILDNCQKYDTYKLKLPKSFNLNQLIDKDTSLVIGPIGCGDN